MKLKNMFLTALIASSLSVGAVALADNATNNENFTQVHVTGSASQQIKPDYALLTVGIDTKATTVSEAKAKSDSIMSQVIANLLKLGLNRADIATSNFSVMPNYNYKDGNAETSPASYSINNTVFVRINNLKNVSKVIDTVTTSGANNINSLRFMSNNDQKIEDELTKNAVKDARHKAEVLAAALDMKVVGVNNLTLSSSQRESSNYNIAFFARSLSSTTPIEEGELQISKNVNITFALGK